MANLHLRCVGIDQALSEARLVGCCSKAENETMSVGADDSFVSEPFASSRDRAVLHSRLISRPAILMSVCEQQVSQQGQVR